MSATIMPPTPQPKPEKRARQESETIEDLDESALAKKARKDARVSSPCPHSFTSNLSGHAQS